MQEEAVSEVGEKLGEQVKGEVLVPGVGILLLSFGFV